MQASDGNLVLYRVGGTAVWASGARGGGARLEMQGDGNLVIYSGSQARWATNTAGFPGARLVVQNDGNVVVYAGGVPVWAYAPGYIGDTLNGGGTLAPGAQLRSADGRYTLVMQGSDGNLVLYGPGGAQWATGARGAGTRAEMQASDGNFVLYRGGEARWATNTSGRPGARLVVQNDGNVVVYHGGQALWSRLGVAPPPPASAHPAASWAASQLGRRVADPGDAALFGDWAPGPYGEWSGDCAKFAYVAWLRAGVQIARGNAREQYLAYAGRIQGGPAPAGALVFWPNVAAPFGHIAISDGAGGVYTTQGLDHANLPIARVAVGHFGTPAGWVMP